MKQEMYLDNSSTTKVFPEVAEKMNEILLNNYGNPSSLHRKGFYVEKEIKNARNIIADILKVDPMDIYFCSGGTEANNWAIKSVALRYKKKGKHLITTSIEHPSVLMTFKQLEEYGFEVTYLPVDKQGNISLEDLKNSIRDDTTLVSIMHVNNELGTILPIEEIGKIVKDTQAFFHVDGVQSFCKLGIYPKQFNIDLLSLSAHKIHGPKGTGALYVNKKVILEPLLVGGGQEAGKRAGTENVPGIVGFGVASRIMATDMVSNIQKMMELKQLLLQKLKEIPGVHFNGNPEASWIINVWFEGIKKAEVLLHLLEEEGVFVSTGSACHSRNPDPSHVLQAIGAKDEALYGAIRISIGTLNTENEILAAASIIEKKVEELRMIT